MNQRKLSTGKRERLVRGRKEKAVRKSLVREGLDHICSAGPDSGAESWVDRIEIEERGSYSGRRQYISPRSWWGKYLPDDNSC